MLLSMTVAEVIGLISTIIGLVGAIAALIPVIIKLVRVGKELVKNKDWDKLKNIAMAAMKKAEESGKTGAEKKEMVIETVKAACLEAGVDAGEYIEDLVEYIDDTISFVNDMKKKK